MFTLDAIQDSTAQSHVPSFSIETLSPHGYYYELVSCQLGLKNFNVYTFSSFPERFFLYLSTVDCLIEVPTELLHVGSEDMVPQEFLVPSGLLYQSIRTHTVLTHMSFYSFPVLPGRLFVFDVGLDRLIETRRSSPLAESLLGSFCHGTKSTQESHRGGSGRKCFRECTDYNSDLRPTSCFSLQFKLVKSLQNGKHVPSTLRSGTMQPVAPKTSPAVRSKPMSSIEDTKHDSLAKIDAKKCSEHCEFSVADMTVYEPSSLNVPLLKPTLHSHCFTPPCVYYNGADDDPR